MIRNLAKLLAKIITIGLAILTFFLAILSIIKPELIKDFILFIKTIIESIGNWNYLIAFSSALIESLPVIGTVLPGMNIMILVGWFFGKEHFIGTVFLAIFGAMIGNYLGYWLGARFWHDFIESYGDWFGIGKTEARILENQTKKNGPWYIILGKFNNFTRAFVPFIAGSGGMNEKKFWLYNAIGSTLWAVTIICIGIFFAEHYETILDNLEKIVLALIIWFAL